MSPHNSEHGASPSAASPATTPPSGAPPTAHSYPNLEATIADILGERTTRRRIVDPLKHLKRTAWWFCRYHNPYIYINTVFDYGAAYESGAEDKMKEYGKQRQSLEHAYLAIKAKDPYFVDTVAQADRENKPEIRRGLISLFRDCVANARSDDVGSLQKNGQGLRYLEPGKTLKEMTIDVSAFKSRELRGFNDPFFARLLCPHKFTEKFEADPKGFTKLLKDGKVELSVSNYPRVFYDDSKHDELDPSVGLFRSPQLILVYKHLFTSPSSTDSVAHGKSGYRGQSRLNKVSRVKGRDIAYAAMHLRHICSSQASWQDRDDNLKLNLEQMFLNIVTLFENGSDWAQSTLEWWDMEIFAKGPEGEEHSGQLTAGDSDHAIMLQRMTRRPASGSQNGGEGPDGDV